MNAALSTVEATVPAGRGEDRDRADRIGVIASVLCAIHCAVTPFLLLFAPTFGKIWSHPASHWVVALFVVPLALVMVVRGFRVHRKSWIVATGLAGVVFVVIGAFIPYLESGSRKNSAVVDQLDGRDGAEAGALAGATENNDVFVWHADDPLPETPSTDDGEVFVWNAGEPLPETECESQESSAGQCMDSCCPSLVTDSEGNTKLHIPPASIVTTLGGVALICTHLGNLCACRRRRKDGCCSSPLC